MISYELPDWGCGGGINKSTPSNDETAAERALESTGRKKEGNLLHPAVVFHEEDDACVCVCVYVCICMCSCVYSHTSSI